MTHPEVLTRIQTAQAQGGSALDLGGLDPDFLSEVPEDTLSKLKNLSLNDCRLPSLPPWVSHLQTLEDLDLSGNQLSALPESLGQLTQLQSLSAWGNQLSALPESLGQLTQLRSLSVGGNQLSALPESLGQLTQLQSLDVARNQLSALPEWLGQLTQLQSLRVTRNQLTALPEGVVLLPTLTEIDAANNRLADLPRGLRQLPLTSLWLQGNPGLGLPAAVLGKYLDPWESDRVARIKSPGAILDAFFSARDLDGQPLDEIKLVLVGRGAAGKTSVAHRLIHNRFKRNCQETQGVDISRWRLHCEEREVDVNVWDFAGQVMTHSTHQFFLSESSVYVLVLTGREDTQGSDADYWLRLIRAFASDESGNTSPVVVVLNKYEQHPFNVDRNALREKYPFIADFIVTDCRSGLGMDKLRQTLANVIQAMPIIRHRFKLAWWRIKERLEKAQRKQNYLPYSTFQEICIKEGEHDADRQRILADVFHALGVALNFGSDERLRNATVLNPRWVTENIYKLLRQGVVDDGSAELTAERVAEVLPGEPEVMRSYLVELMRRFDLVFPVSEHASRWLVPQRLPAEQPDLGGEWTGLTDATRLRYSYPVIPEGLLPRFISRTYPLSEGEDGKPLPRWVNGVVLEDRGARALVRVDSESRRIDVVCKGPKEDRLFLLGVIQADFRALHEQISGLDQSEDLEVEGRADVYVSVTGLRADEAQGKASYASTRTGSIALNATAELDRLSEPPARRDEWRPRVFISYSSCYARQRDELLTRLKPMRETQGLVDTWDDRCISPGEEWDGVIRKELQLADVVLLLASPKFLASDYIKSVEVDTAVRRHKASETLVIPIILEECGYEHESFGAFNALPRKGKPVRDAKPQRKAWYQIETELRQVFVSLKKRRDEEERNVTDQKGSRRRVVTAEFRIG